jgi:hypothetical protein
LALSLGTVWACRAEIVRSVPGPLPTHPGNIFLAGENIVIAAPPGEVETWRAVDYEGKVAAKGRLREGKAEVGKLPVGWYKVVRGVGHVTNRTFLCVLEPLHASTPLASPICIDVAMSWFFPKEKMGDVTSLCRLAGINRVRDRILWDTMEPKRGEFAGPNQYDASAEAQEAAGLQILQVAHNSSSWANPNQKRFPLDLRDIYNFYREMARRWKGKVGAFEPWNEADIAMFGGHTGSEMATLQKAGYLGLKAGNREVTACLNVFAIRRGATLKDFQQNEPWGYFDIYNLHHYEPLENYPALYADHRAVSGGKPMWVSECSVHIKWRGDEALKELGDDDLCLQSERLTKTYALAIHEGAEAVFYFMLPHYTEGKLQYGLLRSDLTPRPGYVALAAAGRLLADAKPLGRVKSAGENVTAFLFEAKPDGKPADVLVIWSESQPSFDLARLPIACFDHLGRARPITNNTLRLSPVPMYAVLAKGSRPALTPPPQPAKLLTGKPGAVVIQAILPEKDIELNQSAYKVEAGQPKSVPVFLYNFGQSKVRGKLSVVAPKDWKAELPTKVELAPGDRKELAMTLTPSTTGTNSNINIRINGDFGSDERPALSLHFISTTE